MVRTFGHSSGLCKTEGFNVQGVSYFASKQGIKKVNTYYSFEARKPEG